MVAGNEIICHKVATFGFQTFSFIVNFHTCSHTSSPKFPLQFTLLISCLRSFFCSVFQSYIICEQMIDNYKSKFKGSFTSYNALNVKDLLSNVCVITMNVTNTTWVVSLVLNFSILICCNFIY
jgi:hypothetical protein